MIPSSPPVVRADRPRASIVVPAWNGTATLPETLDSLRAQRINSFEIVVVDDGSTDGTAAMVRGRRDRRIRLVHQANRGLAGARNTGIAEARGAYIGFCDADDLWHPGKLAAHVAHLDARPFVGLSFSGSALIDPSGAVLRTAQRPRLTGIDAAHVFRRNPVGNGSTAVMRRATLGTLAWTPEAERERPWVFDESFRRSEDIECWLRLALTTSWRIEGVPGLLTAYRVAPGGLSADTDAHLAGWTAMVDKLRPLAPGFFAAHEPAARAYQLRYLARRAVASGDGARAWRLTRAALASSVEPLREEPAKTLVTLAAALALRARPART